MKFNLTLFLTLTLISLGVPLSFVVAFENLSEKEKIEQGEQGRPEKIPTFEVDLLPLEKEGAKQILYNLEGKPVRLSDTWKEKPVLLVTSSLTCPISRDNCPAVDSIRKKFGDKINVVVIYTTEAHPKGSASPYSNREWLTSRNVHDKILVNQPTTLQERIARAIKYKKRMNIQSTILVDNMKNTTWKLLGGGPNSGLFIEARKLSPEKEDNAPFGDPFIQNGNLPLKSKGKTKRELIKLLERQGWLSPHKMEIAIRSYFNGIFNEKLKKSIKNHGYNKSRLRELYLGKKIGEIKANLNKHPDWIHFRVSFDRGNYKRNTFLHLAVKRKLLQHAELFIHHNAKVNAINYRGETPLHVAATTSLKMVELLLKHNADVNVYTPEGLTPLHKALLKGKTKIAKKLITHGARIDLNAAAALGDQATLSRFLNRYQVDKTKLQKASGTALAFAARNSQTAIVKQLLAVGASVNLKTEGYRPLFYAIEIDHGDIIKLLIKSKANTSDPLVHSTYFTSTLIHYAADNKKNNALELLLKNGVDPDTLNAEGETPLHLAAASNHLSAIKILLKHKASIDALSGSPMFPPCGPPDFDSRPYLLSAVHFAVINGHTKIVRYLIQQGAKTHFKDRNG
ncbi:hypothetical protein MNBD_PLANCTO02-1198, partial [hydrothermal vent metagenome]